MHTSLYLKENVMVRVSEQVIDFQAYVTATPDHMLIEHVQ